MSDFKAYKCTKFDFRWGSAYVSAGKQFLLPDPTRIAKRLLPDPTCTRRSNFLPDPTRGYTRYP